MSPSPTSRSGLKRRSNSEFLTEAGTPLTGTFLMALMMGLNHQVSLLAFTQYIYSKISTSLRSHSFLYHISEKCRNFHLTQHGPVFSSQLTASSAVSFLHSPWSLQGIESYVLRKYHQANAFLLNSIL